MVILNVLTPFALSELQSNINKANFISVMTDASNHKDTTRIFLILLTNFEPSKGVLIKVLEFKSLPRERAETESESITNCLSGVNARDKDYLYLC
jgi:hypothetical protein